MNAVIDLNMVKPQTNKKPSIIILMIMVCMASVTAVLIAPALPALSKNFHVPLDKTQWLISLFLAGYVIGQLIYGPLAKLFTAKRALIFGLFINLIGIALSILAFYWNSYLIMLIGRIVSALGASAGLVCSFIMINEYFSSSEAHKILAYPVLAFTFGAGIATTIGGVLTHYLNTISCFVFLFIYGALAIIACLFIPKSPSKPTPGALNICKIAASYFKSFTSKNLLIFSYLLGLSGAFSYLFATFAPIFSEVSLHINPAQYGYWNLINMVGILLGALCARLLTNRMDGKKALVLSIVGSAIIIGLLDIYFYLNLQIIYVFFILSAVMFFFGAITYTNAAFYATNAIADKESASASANFINMGLTFVMVLILSLGSMQYLKEIFIHIEYVLLGLGLFLFLFARKAKVIV